MNDELRPQVGELQRELRTVNELSASSKVTVERVEVAALPVLFLEEAA